MKLKHNFLIILILALVSTFIFTACDNNNDDELTNSKFKCTITYPEDDTEFAQGEIITIVVEAIDQGDNLQEVQFYKNRINIGSVSSLPYELQWNTRDEDPGSFIIRAEAINGMQEKVFDEITIVLVASENGPEALFEADQTTLIEGDSVLFTDQSIYNPTSWSWDFGDGNTSIQKNPSNTYNHEGTYTIQLTVSNNYGADTETKTDYITVESATGSVTDIDGNVYNTIIIGNQEWMAENLKTTTLNNNTSILYNIYGDAIPHPAYCWYDHDETQTAETYGALYNWYAVNSQDLCPDGWHVPSLNEWWELIEHLGGRYIAGGKMKEAGTIHWNSPNTGATNESGFSALPGGNVLFNSNPQFNGLGYRADFWTSTRNEYDYQTAHVIYLLYEYEGTATGVWNYRNSYSVRCIKD